ncbi:MAG: rRNA adenine methyltransferase [Alphaproteobacteria bacterium]|nr:rRNA adenine methyltransferase [Alphaproteobacteria bacterium]
MRVVQKTQSKDQYDAAEWAARVDLAAAHRLAVMHGFSEGIYNHFTLLVPGRKDRFLTIPFGLHWSEVTASCMITADLDGNVVAGDGELERSSFCIHAPIHRLLPQAACVFHTHMPFTSALTRLEDQHIKAIGQTEVSMMGLTAYDDQYTGFARDPAEGARLAKVLGPDKNILFMANHGVVVAAESVAHAYDLLYYMERAAQVQLYAMWTGQKLRGVNEAVVNKAMKQFVAIPTYYGRPHYELHFEALKRQLDAKPPKRYDD